MTTSQHVFISYSNKDYHFVERLRSSLNAANIPYWIDREGLQAGTANWEKAIRAAIQASSAVILVASPNAYNSDYVQDEVAIAQMYARTIYPVWAHGDHWIACVPMGMGKAQYIDLREDRFENNFVQVVKALSGLLPDKVYVAAPIKPPAPGVTRRSPYKGLAAFQEADSGDFFGRFTAISDLLKRFMDRASAETGRLLAVIGASGSGKSSVVMAGLIPRLKKGAITGSENWLYIPPITPGNTPIRALTRGLNRAAPENPFSTIEQELRHPSGRGLANFTYSLDRRVVLYIDQFEELFMPGVSADERDQTISLIVQAANEPHGNLTALLTLRADFYDRPTNYRELGALISTNNYTLLPMSLSELREAVESPTQLPDVGLAFEPGLVGDIVFELRESKDRMALAGALPLLQFTLQQLYERRDQSGEIHLLTLAVYTDIGGVIGAISQHAETVFSTLDEEAQSRLGRVFVRLINVDERGEATRERAHLSDFESDAAALRLIDSLVKARLLLANRDDESATLEVAHEALLRNWDRLVTWIESAAESKRLLQKLEVDAAFWAKRGKPRDQFRYVHEQEVEIEAIRDQWGITFDSLLQEFLEPETTRLIEDLRGDEWRLSMQVAQKRLFAIGVEAVPPLISALGDLGKNLRVRVVSSLGELGDARAVEPLITALSDDDYPVRSEIAEVLGRLGDLRAVEPLIAALADVEWNVRIRAAEALGQLGDKRAVEALITTFADPDDRVQRIVGKVLEQLDGSQFVDALINAMADPRGNWRWRAAETLGQLGDKRAVEPLITALADPEDQVRLGSAEALGRLGDKRAVEPLITTLGDANGNVRRIAVEALGLLSSDHAVNKIISSLNDPDGNVRWSAAKALAHLGDKRSVKPLIDALGDPDWSVRGSIAEALGLLGDRSALDALTRLLTDNSDFVRGAAKEALAKLRGDSPPDAP